MLEHQYFWLVVLLLMFNCIKFIINFYILYNTTNPSIMGPPEHTEPDLVEQLRSVGSVDELMRIVYPNYWSMLKCRSKTGARFPHREPGSTETRSEEASFAAAYFNFEILKSIETEWRKTLCMPRQVCLDVGKEFGAATNTFYKPPCVSVYRCGGCCNSEEHQCMNISTSYISKTLFEITVPLKQGTKPVTISFANHTSCSCLSKLDSFEQDFCGPNKELDEETCQCVCRKQLRTAGCGPNRYLDKNTCQCVCKVQPSSCGPQQSFNKDTCQCTCAKVCPKSQPLNRTKCVCECTETPNKCFLKGRRFQPATCRRSACATARTLCKKGESSASRVLRVVLGAKCESSLTEYVFA
ncbi:putative vascular endothelial growth factor C [Triplophysa rosa]|uniref:Vascular endothelial growth factor C n=1 Tax=Triplophysa rosa TaxID=992332 RepID=A0A9W8C908_TRIRA|nr:putative vascular endothelial growth factor C [Triplophysa rosa]